MSISPEIELAITELGNVPRGEEIENPNQIFVVGFLDKEIALALHINERVCISRKSIKHIIEQRGGEIIKSIPEILLSPTKVVDNSAKRPNSYLIIKMNGKAKAAVLDITKTTLNNRVVSAFRIDNKTYKKLIDISGRSDVPPLNVSSVESDFHCSEILSPRSINPPQNQVKSASLPH